jgi:syntaxin 16
MSAGAYEDDGDVVIEMDLLPPRWLDVQDEVTEALTQIATETRKLEQLHQKHVLPGFDDEDVKKREEREIERLTQLITRKFQECQKAIKRIDALIAETRDHGGVNRSEETMARNLMISLASRVGEASALFRKKQSAYLKSTSTKAIIVNYRKLILLKNFAPLEEYLLRYRELPLRFQIP